MILVVLIVKNEEENIEKTLFPFLKNSFFNFFILDTGSTDKTVEIVKNFFKENKIKGVLQEEKFVDFSTTRNKAIELSKKYFDLPFIIFPDAEWYIKGIDFLIDFAKKELYSKNLYYYITIKTSKLIYQDIRFFKSSAKIFFKGPVHEYIPMKGVELPENIYFEWSPTNLGIEKSIKRWDQDVEILLKIPKKSSRDVFYLAQTYCNLKKYQLAEYSYKERISMKGPIDEIFYSYYKLGDISKDFKQKFNYYIKSFEILPIRAEPLIKISMILEDIKTKIAFINLAIKMELPKSLFVNSYLYKIRINLLKEFSQKLELSETNKTLEKTEILETNELSETNELLEKTESLEKTEILEKTESLETTESLEKTDILKNNEILEKTESLEINEISQKNKKGLTIAILARNKDFCMGMFLKCIESQDYPKNKISLYIRSNNNNDSTIEILNYWLKKNSKYYKNVFVDFSDVNEENQYVNHLWNEERINILAKIRIKSINYAIENGDDYFTVDCDNFIKYNTISELYKSNCDVVSAFMKCDENGTYKKYSNYHADINKNGYYSHNFFYDMIFNRTIIGEIEVPVVHCNYLIKNEVLQKIYYEDETKRHEYVVFSESCRKNNIKQHINNREIFGYITFSNNTHELMNESWYKNFKNLIKKNYHF